MSTARQALVQEILSTFEDRRLGLGGVATWEEISGEDQELREQLSGRSWRSVSDEEISQVPLCLLTDHALSILIPAVILAVLRSDSEDFRVDEMLFNPNHGPSSRERINNVVQSLKPKEGFLVLKYLRLGAAEDNKLANFTAGCAADYVSRLIGDKQHLIGPQQALAELDRLLAGLPVPEASDCFNFDVSNGPPTQMEEGESWRIVGGKRYDEFPCDQAFLPGATNPVLWLDDGDGLDYYIGAIVRCYLKHTLTDSEEPIDWTFLEQTCSVIKALIDGGVSQESLKRLVTFTRAVEAICAVEQFPDFVRIPELAAAARIVLDSKGG